MKLMTMRSPLALSASVAAVAATVLCAGPALADHVRGTQDDDHLYGGPGRDFLMDGAGDDDIRGGVGADSFNVRRGADFLFAGVGRDSILVYHDGSADFIKCGAGVDRVQYTGPLERHDTFHGCEHVDPYSPKR
jgi:Ca2+-binding RTX toxin-like protein